MLKELPAELSKLLKSQQYIHDLYIIVKELVENSLDAQATEIKIIITDSSIVIEDNGFGIENLDLVCRSGYSSKESTSYHVLGLIQTKPTFTHGFRGQALSAINTMCDVEILTKTSDDHSLGLSKDFNTGIIEKKPREKGTTVKVNNIFKDCPIRRENYKKTTRKSLGKIICFLNTYLYVYDVHFILLFNNIIIFDEIGSRDTREYSLSKHTNQKNNEFMEVNDSKFDFLLFPADKSGSQVILAEKRICKFEKASSIIKSIFKMYFDHNPTFVLVIKDDCDVNLSVDKTEVILRNCKYIENKIKSEMDRYFALKHFVVEKGRIDDVSMIEINDSNKDNSTAEYKKRRIDDVSMIEINDSNKDNSTAEYEKTDSERCVKPNIKNTIDQCCNIIIKTPENVFETHSTEESTSKNNCQNNCNDVRNQNVPETPQSQIHSECSKKLKNEISTQKNRMSVYNLIKEETMSHSSFILDKADFKNMQIIGQFNHGFILCTLEKNDKQFLIVIDQHAADEIYNYEKLKKSFRLKTQKLLSPIKLKLNSKQKVQIDEYAHVLNNNGFSVIENELHTIPTYQNTFFTVEDLYALIEDLSNGIEFTDKYRKIIASKACRSSIMIGEALGNKEMRRIVDNLSLLDFPWNCPHGRPTFKVLTELL